ncbi:MAG: HEAT repeat domain-containing protein [Candidatus Riflebacteria bacterium]|nr:HEAT repeat domain-containing protein [Candidatus Riflebacteria bacterium]
MENQDEVRSRILKQFLFALKDVNPNLRFLALEGIQYLAGEACSEEIAPILNDNDRFVKWKAIQTCGILKITKLFNELSKLLHSSDMNTRAYTALSLGHLGTADAGTKLSEAFVRETSPKVRQTIIRSFTYLKEHPQWETLAKASRDNDLGVRLDLAKLLGEMAPEQNALDILLNLLEQESNNHVFATAILALGRFNRAALIGYFQHSLLHQEPRIRANAIEAMSNLPFECIEAGIRPYLNDPSNRVKANVISIFFQNNQINEMMTELNGLLFSDSRWERASGAWLAGKFKVASVTEKLIDLLADPEGVVAERTAWALGCIRSVKTFPALLEAYKKANQWALVHIVKAMGETASQNEIPALVFLLEKEKNPLLKSSFLEILAKLKVTDSINTALKMRSDLDARVRTAAYMLIGKLAPVQHSETLFEGLKDTSVKIRAICADLMIKAGDLRALKTLSSILKDPDKLQRIQSYMTLKELALITSDNG